MISPSDLVQLPIDERLKCMEALWQSLRSDDQDSPAWHRQVLSERSAKLERGEAEVISGKELKARLSR